MIHFDKRDEGVSDAHWEELLTMHHWMSHQVCEKHGLGDNRLGKALQREKELHMARMNQVPYNEDNLI